MDHDQIKEGISMCDIVVVDKGNKGKAGRTKFEDGGDISITFKEHWK